MRRRASSGDSFILQILSLLEAIFQSVDELGEFCKDNKSADGDEQCRHGDHSPREAGDQICQRHAVHYDRSWAGKSNIIQTLLGHIL